MNVSAKIGTLGRDGTQIRTKWSRTWKKLKSTTWFQPEEDLEYYTNKKRMKWTKKMV